MSMPRELLAGWGGTAPTSADVRSPSRAEEVTAILAGGPTRGAVARGLGRSYGDAAQNAGGTVVATTRLGGVTWADEPAGLVRAGGGTSLGDLLGFLLPRGRALPVVPGTRHVTVGGAIAADVHGKNHPGDGSFAGHVVDLTLAAPSGVRRLTPEGDAEPFWATAGGMGLTGVVLETTLRTVAVETSAVRVTKRRAADLDELMSAMEAEADRHRYLVAWIDALASGAAAGRGVLSWGDHAAVADLPSADQRASPLGLDPPRTVRLPPWCTGGRVPATAVAAMNRLRYRRGPASASTTVEPLDRFLFPLDAVDGWNRLYGRAGFVQYQFVVPFRAGDVVRLALERLQAAGCPPFLAVLKRLGAADPGPLSFPMPGWTLAVDFPAALPGLAAVLDGLDESVAGAGGRVYLAKDARLRPDLLGAMYPDLDRWRSARDRLDPDGVLTSDLGRRLGLVASRPAGRRAQG
ncbi:MAG: FAD-binding oxidoreductase [Actinomycetota bacterium]|nr:FAD-binding oxidoreductase [Actinomycetota bacterium]